MKEVITDWMDRHISTYYIKLVKLSYKALLILVFQALLSFLIFVSGSLYLMYRMLN